MKKYLAICLFIVVSLYADGQQVFRNISFQEALLQSGKEGQILMVHLMSRSCTQCNDVAQNGFSQEPFIQKIAAEKIIATEFSAKDKDWQILTARYEIPDGLALLFFSPSGELIHRYMASTSGTMVYVQQVDIAKKNLGEIKAMRSFEAAYAEGSRNTDLLKQLIVYRNLIGKDYGPVLDDFVRSLPADSLKSVATLQYIAANAPVLKSYADSVMRSDRDKFSEAWYRMDLPTRVAINNKIIDKSMKIAIKEKSFDKAITVAGFAASVNSNNMARIKAFNQSMARYSRSVKDTAGYFSYATMLYDRYYMMISVDSIKRKDSLDRMQMINARPQPDFQPNSGNQQVNRTISYTPTDQFFAGDLNNGAFSFYTMNAPDSLLRKAMAWSARSLAFNETAANLDTYARLLYKTGKKDSAVHYQKKAVDLQLKSKFPSAEYEKVLKRMQDGEAKIDEYCCEETAGGKH